MNGSNSRSGARPVALTLAFLLSATAVAAAQSTTNYDELYAKYLAAARSMPAAPPLWMADLARDPNAHRVNDLVTIRVEESLSATGSADSNVNKASSGDVKLPTPASKVFSKVFPVSTDTKFAGSGATTRTTELTATLTARVMEVLPNGDLAIEGVREVDINGDKSVVVLSGVVRALDIQPGNLVASSSIGQLRIQSLSQGLIKDSLQPGWLVRALNKVF
jgi:flagellar L-ring protein precursor FlgH